MQTIIINYLNTLPSSTDANKLDRVRRSLQLVVTSPDFAIEK